MQIKHCKIEGCPNKYYGNGYCHKHYKQVEKHGHILENTRFEPNKTISDFENNVAYIILYDKQGLEVAKAIIDLEDVEKVKKYRWSYRRRKYVVCNAFKGKSDKMLTHFILNSEGKAVYHKNLNTLDCRKENLTLTIGNRIKNKEDNVFRILIKNSNIENKEIAQKLGLTHQAVSLWRNGANIPLKYIDKLSNVLGVEKEVLRINFDVSRMKYILNKIEKFKEENPDLPISVSKNYEYIFPVEIEDLISYDEEQYFKRNIKSYQMILNKIK